MYAIGFASSVKYLTSFCVAFEDRYSDFVRMYSSSVNIPKIHSKAREETEKTLQKINKVAVIVGTSVIGIQNAYLQ